MTHSIFCLFPLQSAPSRPSLSHLSPLFRISNLHTNIWWDRPLALHNLLCCYGVMIWIPFIVTERLSTEVTWWPLHSALRLDAPNPGANESRNVKVRHQPSLQDCERLGVQLGALGLVIAVVLIIDKGGSSVKCQGRNYSLF